MGLTKKEYNAKYYAKHKKEISERSRAYYLKNKEKIKARARKYRKNNLEIVRKKNRKYHRMNSNKISEKRLQKRLLNPQEFKDEKREQGRRLRWKMHEKRASGECKRQQSKRLDQKKWKEENRLRINAQARLRYHIKKGSVKRPTICPICNKKPKLGVINAIFDDHDDPITYQWMCSMCHGEYLSKKFDNKLNQIKGIQNCTKGQLN